MPPVPKPKRTRQPIFLKEWRQHRGLTQEQLAERIGISAPNLGRIENGKLPYNQDFLELAAEALMCDPADIIIRKPGPDSPWSIIDGLKKAPARKQEEIKAVVETMLKSGTDG